MELIDLKSFFEIIESGLTGIAIIVGGIWTYIMFVKKREKYPRASISHSIVEKDLTNEKKLVHVFIEIENIGSVLLSLDFCNIEISQVFPPGDELKNGIDNNDIPRRKNSYEIPWPNLFEEKKDLPKGQYELEPQEKEEFNCDLVIDKNIKTIQVYSYFRNKSKPKRDIGWRCTTFHDLN